MINKTPHRKGAFPVLVFCLAVTCLADYHETENQGRFSKASSVSRSSKSEQVTYKIARSVPGANPKDDLHLMISVEPANFVRDQMLQLARQLNQDFPDKQKLYAQIMDDEKIAENVIPFGASYPAFMKLKRGEYYLDRKRGKEYIAFSTKRGRPATEIVLNLGPMKKRRK